MATNLYGYICLSDIPKECITTANNGKKYLNVDIYERRFPSQYGHTHYIKVGIRKELQKEGVNYFIGDLKPATFSNSNNTTAASPDAPAATTDAPAAQNDLQF